MHPSISMEKKLSHVSWELRHTAGKFPILTEHASLTQISAGCAASTSYPGTMLGWQQPALGGNSCCWAAGMKTQQKMLCLNCCMTRTCCMATRGKKSPKLLTMPGISHCYAPSLVVYNFAGSNHTVRCFPSLVCAQTFWKMSANNSTVFERK